jgi:phage shock protein A
MLDQRRSLLLWSYGTAGGTEVGLFSRFTTFIKAKFSAAMDRAEDPNETLDYSYQKQLEQLQNLRKSIADVNQDIEKRDSQARLAVQQGQDDLAREALTRKAALQTQLDSFSQQIAQLKAQQQRFVEMERRLSSRVEQFRTQKEMVKAQYNAASAQVKIQEAVTGISEEMTDVNLAVQRAQDKVLSMQARAQAMDQLVDQGTLPEIGAPGGDDIDRQLAQLTSKSAVDDQLAQLKAEEQAKLPPPTDGQAHEQAQLPPPTSTTEG